MSRPVEEQQRAATEVAGSVPSQVDAGSRRVRAASWLAGRPGRVVLWVAVVGCAAGLLAGLRGGPLWLDETLSVEIARLGVPELFDALRQDGSPPLYYLLLHAWMEVFGTGTVAVRVPSVLLTALALFLAHRLGGRLAGPAGARAAVIVLASLPWTMRFGSETRMYLLVVVLVLAGALALLEVHATGSRRSVAALAAVVAALLYTHYWAMFLLAGVGLLHLPGLLRGRPAATRVAVAGVLGAVPFLPWVPSFLFQVAHTGAPWSSPPPLFELVRTPRYWGGGTTEARTLLAAVLVPLALLGTVLGRHRRTALVLVSLVVVTLLQAWVSAQSGGAYTGRYTAVVVPLFTLAAALGALALPGRALPLLAVTVAAAIGLWNGIPATGVARTSAAGIAEAFHEVAEPGDVIAYCPDQLGPPVARMIGDGYTQVVYPTLGPPQIVDWVDYAERQAAADPNEIAARLHELAGARQLFVLKASGYRTFERQCERLLSDLTQLRGQRTLLFGELQTTGQQLYRYGPA